MKSPMIPQNEEGQETNTENKLSLNSPEEASMFFLIVKNRLLNVNEWHDMAGQATASFQLTDANGNDVNRLVQNGDHFKIGLPAPGPAIGDGFDWVKVEALEIKDDFVAIRVRPAPNPLSDKKDIAHFFKDSATSSFVIQKRGNTVTAGIYGRNEKPNTTAGKTVDKLRNTAIATGAVAGFAKIQWKALVNGLTARTE